jgi:RNA polymerase sigma-70 factor (ECF subfamily)
VPRKPGTDRPDAVEFCRLVYPRLVRSLALYCGDAAVAEELTQETLVRVWERWSKVAELDAPDAWAFRVGFNLANSWARRRAAERRAHARLARDAAQGTVAERQDTAAVRPALLALPPRQRAAVVLRYLADLSVADTAEALGCEPGTVRALTSQGVAGLRARLAVSIDEEEREHA